jgi:hypothetical protein
VTPDNAEFIAEIARQLAAVSAFLGGFAATFLGILLQSHSPRRHVGWAAGAAAVASASFMIAVIAGTLVALVANPSAPKGFATPEFLALGAPSSADLLRPWNLYEPAKPRFERLDSFPFIRFNHIHGCTALRGNCLDFRAALTRHGYIMTERFDQAMQHTIPRWTSSVLVFVSFGSTARRVLRWRSLSGTSLGPGAEWSR